MTRILLYLYVLSLPFTSAFAITPVVSIALVLMVVLSGIYLVDFSSGARNIKIQIVDIPILIFWVFLVFSFFFNSPDFISNKPINHLFAYTYVLLGNYFLLKNLFLDMQLKNEIKFSKIIYLIGVGLFMTSFIGTIEFLSKNFWGFDIDELIPRVAVPEYSPLASSYIRVRSVVEESGHLSFYYELLAPIGLYGIRKSKSFFYITLFFTVLTFIFSFSSAGWAIVIGLLGIVILIQLKKILMDYNRKYNLVKATYAFIIAIVIGVVLLYFYQVVAGKIIEATIVDKLTDSGSADDRSGRAGQVFETLKSIGPYNLIFGFGPAAYETLRYESSPIVLYLVFLLENGLIGLLLFIAFLGFVFLKMTSIKNITLRSIFICSFIAGVAHYFVIGNYYYPWFWILIILSFMAERESKTGKN